jgi:5-oxopent-3-ene-1,2,5-tricarboxylate decarboxylase/2-hydroxyhepta-2,4-diene-1,7-dioate isomerase
MKLARFAVDGNLQEGHLTQDGLLRSGSGKVYDPDNVAWLPPVTPTKVIGLALNFADHADELKMESPPEPALFFNRKFADWTSRRYHLSGWCGVHAL